jgi:hypothetical protein
MPKQEKASSAGQHRCKECGKSFDSENALRQHEKDCAQAQSTGG